MSIGSCKLIKDFFDLNTDGKFIFLNLFYYFLLMLLSKTQTLYLCLLLKTQF